MPGEKDVIIASNIIYVVKANNNSLIPTACHFDSL